MEEWLSQRWECKVRLTRHAQNRMTERSIVGFVDKKPLHVVVAQNQTEQTCIVITAYPPSPAAWIDFKTRK